MKARSTPVALLLSVALVAVGCGTTSSSQPPDGPDVAGGGAVAGAAPVPGAVAWRYVGHVENAPEDLPSAILATSAEDAQTVVDGTGAVAPEGIDWEREVALFLLQPDDACPDELVGLDAIEGTLQPDWLAPPGGCEEPLIFRWHTVVVHRGHIEGPTAVLVAEPFRRDVDGATVDFPAYDGDVPPAPEPPASMTDAALDEVFADHPVQRCEPLPEQPVAADPPGEFEDDPMGERIDRVMSWLTTNPRWDTERELLAIRDIWGDGEFHLRVAAERADELRADLEAEFGPGVAIVDGVDPGPGEIRDTQDALGPLMGGDGPGSIVGSSGGGRRNLVELSMIDPTREALDRIADQVDPSHVCVEPALSGTIVGDGEG